MKVSFRGVLHHDVEILQIHKGFVVLYDVWMLQRAQDTHLVIGPFYVVFLLLGKQLP